jgi:hypothetical protein
MNKKIKSDINKGKRAKDKNLESLLPCNPFNNINKSQMI